MVHILNFDKLLTYGFTPTETTKLNGIDIATKYKNKLGFELSYELEGDIHVWVIRRQCVVLFRDTIHSFELDEILKEHIN